ncbi:enhanced serine sensitivity protein SseB C-terminal domain-containing protein [Hyphobacterium sp.]|uniref:enhanced serine sensitivity protein SseB C-terminal domain-containing protein n=1 Tax=Hyphobacterium sp. TaxID=2004662 RepID=UPI003B5191D9
MDEFPRNDIEHALQAAASDPAAQAEFLAKLLDSRIYVIGHVPGARVNESIAIAAGDTLSIEHWTGQDGQSYVPFFTSLDALRQSVDRKIGYLSIKGRELFDSTRGRRLVLNPGSAWSWDFQPNEIGLLLDRGSGAFDRSYVHDAAPPVEIGQPRDYPAALVEGLTRLFARQAAVRRAYIALMKDSSSDQPFSLLLGLDLDGEIDLQAIGMSHVTAEYAPDELPVDVLILGNGDDDPSRYFREQAEPFYERSWGQRLKTFLVRP